MNVFAKLSRSGIAVLVALALALVGLIVYLITSLTGYLAGYSMDAIPVVLTIVAILIGATIVVLPDKLGARISEVVLVITSILLIIAFCFFVMARLDLFADVYFIPVNYPEAEEVALNISYIGFVSYIGAIVALIIAGFSNSLVKE